MYRFTVLKTQICVTRPQCVKMTQMTVQLCDSILCDCTVMLDSVHFRHNRKAF